MAERVIIGLGVGVAVIAGVLLQNGGERDLKFAHDPQVEVGVSVDERTALRRAEEPARSVVRTSLEMTTTPTIPAQSVPPNSWPAIDQKSIDAWIADLHHDLIPHNASRAEKALRSQRAAIPGLEHALWSGDYQQRQLAALLLIDFPNCAADARLIEVIVEGLTLDNERIDHYSGYGNIRERVEYLVANIGAAEPWLLDALTFGDTQAKLLSAVCLSTHPSPANPELAVSILAPHLQDDELDGNGELACMAMTLYEQKSPGLALSYYSGADEQAKRFLNRIIRDQTRKWNLYCQALNLLDDSIR